MARRRTKLVICTILILVYCVLFSFSPEKASSVEIPQFELLDVEDFLQLGINAEEEYPSSKNPLKISPIIHQTWRDKKVSSRVAIWIKSWSTFHPTWQYMFWTDHAARCLVREKYNNLLPTYDGYIESIRRADAIRYIILYEYGGVYADMDMESLRTLDPIIRKYSCILAQEPYEHPIMDGNFEHLVFNAFLACAKKHPFMKLAINRLMDFSHFWNVLDSTGPHFLTFIYRVYLFQSNITSDDKDGVYLAPAEYFVPTIDPAKFRYIRIICKTFYNLSKLQQRACISIRISGLQRSPCTISFTNHHWLHTYFSGWFAEGTTRELSDVVPGALIYNCSK
ncbi:hypothetical protein CHS0354_024383 [Potamilus streckersoni]|uniref:Uncharacterized protein n=1 Tax=Potamilus streckersoni TaxID=2493646 RepID=A0AAE0W3N0_9BIVA|nr:hypothetical protein CHS0354_024383 [Potamilus streckersoni]